MSVNKHRIGYQPLSGGIALYRHGKDPCLALEKRDALQEVIYAACRHMLHGTPEGASNEIEIDGRTYVIAVLPADHPKAKDIRS